MYITCALSDELAAVQTMFCFLYICSFVKILQVTASSLFLWPELCTAPWRLPLSQVYSYGRPIINIRHRRLTTAMFWLTPPSSFKSGATGKKNNKERLKGNQQTRNRGTRSYVCLSSPMKVWNCYTLQISTNISQDSFNVRLSAQSGYQTEGMVMQLGKAKQW